MKRCIISIALILSMIPVGVFAQEVSSTEVAALNDVERVTITPASPLFFLKQAFEGVGTLFTFGNEAKAERYAVLAQRRLAEAEQLAGENDGAVEEALNLYQEKVRQAQETAERSGETALERVTRITNSHIGVLEAVLEKVPEEAQDAIASVLERAKERQQLLIDRVEEKNPTKAAELGVEALKERIRATQEGGDVSEKDIERWREFIERIQERYPEVAETLPQDLDEVLEDINNWRMSDELSEAVRERLERIREDVEEDQERALERLRERNPERAEEILRQSVELRSRIESMIQGETDEARLREQFEQQIRSQMSGEGVMEQIQQRREDGMMNLEPKSPLERFEFNLKNRQNDDDGEEEDEDESEQGSGNGR